MHKFYNAAEKNHRIDIFRKKNKIIIIKVFGRKKTYLYTVKSTRKRFQKLR